MIYYILCVVIGYLIGSIPFGYILVKLKKGIDIRTVGSGNIGATNVGRVLGWPWGVLCFLLDSIKGCLPTAYVFTNSYGIYGEFDGSGFYDCFLPNISFGTVIGLSLIIGHLFPLYLRFKGGKGVATALGVFLVITPYPTFIALCTWILFVLVFRYISVASIVSVVSLVISSILLADFKKRPLSWSAHYYIWGISACIIVALLVIIKHIPNIKRLIVGTEPKVKLWGARGKIQDTGEKE
ncbi:MAG: glycerol-3-phosphate 1-O-acyltransferase PlsY [Candidatus Brocadiia bacterium]